jgi:hypothetical protein
MKRIALIVSTGRTGTLALTRILNDRVENAWSQHEPKPAFRRRAKRILREGHTKQDGLYFLASRRAWQALHPEKWYVESNHNLFTAIPMIRSVLPEVLIVHVIRDGRETVTSWLNRYSYIRTLSLTPMDRPGDPAAEQWERWNPLQKTTWYWVMTNAIIQAAEPDLTVRFEDLFHESARGFEALLQRLEGVRYDLDALRAAVSVKHHASSNALFPPYRDWPDVWKRQFDEIAGEAMVHHGYAP